MFCPNCGNEKLRQFDANQPVADFFCESCGDQFELKSQSKKFGRKLVNGAFSTKMKRLASDTSPKLILMHYERQSRLVTNLRVIPKGFFIPSIVEKRAPLKPTARRAGWVGSNILLERIPSIGQVKVIDEGRIRCRESVLQDWRRVRFLKDRSGDARGWLVDVMRCVEKLEKNEFSLSEIYSFEDELSSLYPKNRNVRPKVRQQLQVLRDAGFINFLGGGNYRIE